MKRLLGHGIRLNRTSNFTLSLYPIKNKAKEFREKKEIHEYGKNQRHSNKVLEAGK